MTPDERMARAHEIFDYVWGKDETGDKLWDAADQARAEFLNIADDFTAALEELREIHKRFPADDDDERSAYSDEEIMDYRLADLEAWITPMRELAQQLQEALADHEAERNVA